MPSNPQSSSTGIELQERNAIVEDRLARITNTGAATPTGTTSSDEVVQASLVADSQVPDGGYAWVVITGCAVVTWWFIGTSYCWGVLQAVLVKEGVSSASTLSFVGSLATACISFLGILNATNVRKLGTRVSALLGMFLLGLGEVLSSFAFKNIGGLFVTAGLVTGLGMRCVYP